MAEKDKIWEVMQNDLRTVMDAVNAGLLWKRIEGPKPESTALTAVGPTFQVMCVEWTDEDDPDTKLYNGVATIMSPHICIINLPPSTAHAIFQKAVCSLN